MLVVNLPGIKHVLELQARFSFPLKPVVSFDDGPANPSGLKAQALF